MTPSIATIVGIGSFWMLFIAARRFPKMAITAAIVLDIVGLVALAAFTIYGLAVGYAINSFSPGLQDPWAEYHQIVFLFVGPIYTLVSAVFLVRYLLRKYPISGVIK